MVREIMRKRTFGGVNFNNPSLRGHAALRRGGCNLEALRLLRYARNDDLIYTARFSRPSFLLMTILAELLFPLMLVHLALFALTATSHVKPPEIMRRGGFKTRPYIC